MGWLRIYVGLYSPCPSLWRASTGTTPIPLRECRILLNTNRHQWHRNQIIGRRPIMLTALIGFALGSTICGAASSMNMLIAGRGISCLPPLHGRCSNALGSYTGVGSRGNYFIGANHLFRFAHTSRAWHIQRPHSSVRDPTHFAHQMSLIPCSSWAIGGGVGPVIGGSLAQQGQWWAFSHSLQIETRLLSDLVVFPIGDGYSVREILSIVLSVL
jgi:MFS family permease